eukprot:5622358-Lingulodinium_polyedra.AAC.1
MRQPAIEALTARKGVWSDVATPAADVAADTAAAGTPAPESWDPWGGDTQAAATSDAAPPASSTSWNDGYWRDQ